MHFKIYEKNNRVFIKCDYIFGELTKWEQSVVEFQDEMDKGAEIDATEDKEALNPPEMLTVEELYHRWNAHFNCQIGPKPDDKKTEM